MVILGYEQLFTSHAVTYFVIEKTILNIFIDWQFIIGKRGSTSPFHSHKFWRGGFV